MGRSADHLGRVGNRLRTLPAEGIGKASKDVRKTMMAALTSDAGFGQDRKLSGLRNGRPQTIRVTKRSLGAAFEGRIMAGPRDQRAPLFWREEGTRRGVRGAKVGRYSSRRAYRGHHRGTEATRWWSRALKPALENTMTDLEKMLSKALDGR